MGEKLICPTCKSEHVIKKGFSANGSKRRYLCKDCNKYFLSEPLKQEEQNFYINHKNQTDKQSSKKLVAKPLINKKCPHCGGQLKYKRWSKDEQNCIYLCEKCGKNFSGELSNLKAFIVEKPCPYCGSENIKKSGKLKSGIKRYYCNSCKRGYSENTVKTESKYKPEKCPKCGDTHITLSGHDSKTHKQRYRCSGCGYKFVENATMSNERFVPHEKECPLCHFVGAKKAGKSGNKQYYICLKCDHKYLENGFKKHLTDEEKQQIVKERKNNTYLKDIAEKFGVTARTVSNIINQYKKDLKIKNEKTEKIKKQRYNRLKKRNELRNTLLQKLKNYGEKDLSKFNLPISESITKEFNLVSNRYKQGCIKRPALIKRLKEVIARGNSLMEKLAEENIKKQKQEKVLRIKSIIINTLKGMPEETIMQKYNIKKEEFKRLLKPYYEREKLTKEQKELILQFGIKYNIPVEYVAPYIPCSIKKCNEFMNKYKIPKVITKELDKVQKKLDDTWLDSFLR